MTSETFLDGKVELFPGDCLEVLKGFAANSVDAVVTDPPYGLEFMGKGWDGADGFRRSLNKADTDRPNVFGRTSKRAPEYRAGRLLQVFVRAVAREIIRVLKPGGHVVAFGGTRTYHRLACAIEDVGFEIRDQIAWCYGQGFPKSRDISKNIDKLAGAEREIVSRGDPVKRMIPGADQHKDGWEKNNGREFIPAITAPATNAAREWNGWGTALKPGWEPVVLARKPLSEDTVVANVLRWRTGALNIEAARIEAGRWPANLAHDGSDEVISSFPSDLTSGKPAGVKAGGQVNVFGHFNGGIPVTGFGDSGSAARFFYTAKADADDRIGSKHPTIKPVDLMQWLVRLVTPRGGVILDPFAGTGTTGEAAWREGMRAILIERELEYQDDIRRRMMLCLAGPDERKRESIKARMKDKSVEHGPLFA